MAWASALRRRFVPLPKGGGSGKRTGDWITSHRAWAVRHVAAGLAVAAQRVIIFAAHGTCAAAAAAAAGLSTAAAANPCSSPAMQKAIFADSLVLGTTMCLAAGEMAVRDMRRIVRGGGELEAAVSLKRD